MSNQSGIVVVNTSKGIRVAPVHIDPYVKSCREKSQSDNWRGLTDLELERSHDFCGLIAFEIEKMLPALLQQWEMYKLDCKTLHALLNKRFLSHMLNQMRYLQALCYSFCLGIPFGFTYLSIVEEIRAVEPNNKDISIILILRRLCQMAFKPFVRAEISLTGQETPFNSMELARLLRKRNEVEGIKPIEYSEDYYTKSLKCKYAYDKLLNLINFYLP